MKCRYILPTLAILMTPIALSSSSLLALGGDSHENETESTDVPRSSVPRLDDLAENIAQATTVAI